jgi:hypothetical protein
VANPNVGLLMLNAGDRINLPLSWSADPGVPGASDEEAGGPGDRGRWRAILVDTHLFPSPETGFAPLGRLTAGNVVRVLESTEMPSLGGGLRRWCKVHLPATAV